jgi:peroxiredoxin
MKKLIVAILLPIYSISQSPNQDSTSTLYNKYLKTFSKFWQYWNSELNFSEEYIPADSALAPISKYEFLSAIASGDYIPVRSVLNEKVYYKLHYNGNNIDHDIVNTLKSIGQQQLKYYLMEGRKFDNYNFVDTNGKQYNDSSTKDKIIAIKTFFINCQKCNEEMPELNDLVDRYRKKGVIFISLALDTEAELKTFLKNKVFKYSVVANQTNFITNELKLNAYPTHLIINQNKEIVKVLNDSKYIEPILKKLLAH